MPFFAVNHSLHHHLTCVGVISTCINSIHGDHTYNDSYYIVYFEPSFAHSLSVLFKSSSGIAKLNNGLVCLCDKPFCHSSILWNAKISLLHAILMIKEKYQYFEFNELLRRSDDVNCRFPIINSPGLSER